MGFYRPMHQGQSQARAAFARREKRIENSGNRFRRDAFARVRYDQSNRLLERYTARHFAPLDTIQLNSDFAIRSSVLRCIEQQVEHRAVQKIFIARNKKRFFRKFHLELRAP